MIATDERTALLAMILDETDNDVPRLVYADYLEENGEGDRAEFIRVQVDLAKIEDIEHDCGEGGDWTTTCPACGAHGHAEDLRLRSSSLLQGGGLGSLRNASVWLGEAIREATIFGTATPEEVAAGLRWRRGFIDTISCTLADWLAHGPAICRENPVRPHEEMITDFEPRYVQSRDYWVVLGNELIWSIEGDRDDSLTVEPFASEKAAKLWFAGKCIHWARSKC